MKTTLNKPILGYLSPWGPDPEENRTPIGMQTLLLGTPEQPFVQDIDEKGNVRGFLRVAPLAAHQYVALPAPTEPQVGLPHLCAFTSLAEPGSMLVAAWPDMVGHALQAYPAMRAEMIKRYPIAGFRLAGFILGQAPRYAAASNTGAEPGSESHEFELNRLRIDDQHYYRISPEVLQLARNSGFNIKPPSNNTPTPSP